MQCRLLCGAGSLRLGMLWGHQPQDVGWCRGVEGKSLCFQLHGFHICINKYINVVIYIYSLLITQEETTHMRQCWIVGLDGACGFLPTRDILQFYIL